MSGTSARSGADVLAGVVEDVDGVLARSIEQRGLPPRLAEAIAYTLMGGGKRLRPALLVLSCEAVGGRRADALVPAAAIELIHNFSLVHDDLPAMDDDDLRRGRPTLHVHAGEAMAILAGDAMVSIAFGLLAPAPRAAALVRELATATTEMIAGQVRDTLGGFPPGSTPEQCLRLVHDSKTGALIRAACRMGARCGNAGREDLDRLDRYGRAVGLMFQIVDDLLDVTQTTEHIGKSAGKDEAAGKLTFPGILGIEPSRREIDRLRTEALATIAPLGEPADPLRALCEDMAVRTR